MFGDKPKGNILEERQAQGADARRKEPVAFSRGCCTPSGLMSGSVRRASRCGTPTISAKTPTPRGGSSRSRRPTFTSFATRSWPQGPTLCADCDGRCMAAAGTKAELGNITRFLTYHQGLGDREHARREYAKLSDEARDWSGADLEAARAGVPEPAQLRPPPSRGREAPRLKTRHDPTQPRHRDRRA